MRVGMYKPPSPIVIDKNGRMWWTSGLVKGDCEDHFFPWEGGAGECPGVWESAGDPFAPKPLPRPTPVTMKGCAPCMLGGVEMEFHDESWRPDGVTSSGYAPGYDHAAALGGFAKTILTRPESLVGLGLLFFGKGVIRRIGGVLLGSQLGYSLGAASKCGENTTAAFGGAGIGGYLGWRLAKK